jgi:uncharacterized protein
MFEGFFYALRGAGVRCSPTTFLRLQRALAEGMVTDLHDFYVVARALMVKSERQFDLYDRVFAHVFEGADLDDDLSGQLEASLERALHDWLSDPETLAGLPPEVREAIAGMSPEEVVDYFRERLKDQTEAHQGGSRWIGTGGTSPVGHSGFHPGGMRVGGRGRNHSAIKVAMDRRWVDYADDLPLSSQRAGDALRSLRHLAPSGPRDQLDLDRTIRETVRQGGEIELVFERRLKDKLSVLLFIDNGGWSMEPYARQTRALFAHARDAFRKLRTFYFHNCIYDVVWEDAARMKKPMAVDDLLRAEADTRLVVMGDAAMGPWELLHRHGALDYTTRQTRAGIESLQLLHARFPRSVWINPIPEARWRRTPGANTIARVREVFPMVDLTLGGLERAVTLLKG